MLSAFHQKTLQLVATGALTALGLASGEDAPRQLLAPGRNWDSPQGLRWERSGTTADVGRGDDVSIRSSPKKCLITGLLPPPLILFPAGAVSLVRSGKLSRGLDTSMMLYDIVDISSSYTMGSTALVHKVEP